MFFTYSLVVWFLALHFCGFNLQAMSLMKSRGSVEVNNLLLRSSLEIENIFDAQITFISLFWVI